MAYNTELDYLCDVKSTLANSCNLSLKVALLVACFFQQALKGNFILAFGGFFEPWKLY